MIRTCTVVDDSRRQSICAHKLITGVVPDKWIVIDLGNDGCHLSFHMHIMASVKLFKRISKCYFAVSLLSMHAFCDRMSKTVYSVTLLDTKIEVWLIDCNVIALESNSS